MPRAKKFKTELSVPPLPNQKELDRAMAAILSMSPEEVFQASVRCGIYTPDGQLTESYGGPPAKKPPKRVAKTRKPHGRRPGKRAEDQLATSSAH